MNILLLNTNPVVSRLISLCLRDDAMLLEEITDVSVVKLDRYDIVFVDDASYVEKAQTLVANLRVKKRVYLSGTKSSNETFEGFDEVVTKPFLPSQITAVIEHLKEVDTLDMAEEEEREVSFIFPMLSEESQSEELLELHEDNSNGKKENEALLTLDRENEEEENTLEVSSLPEVLDSHEIEKIKALLNEEENLLEIDDLEVDYETRKVEVITEHLEADGLEIVSEDEMIDLLSRNEDKVKEKHKKSKKYKENKKEKSTKKKKKKKREEDTYSFEETLIAAIEGMKVKKIKKLLKDAEVSISINFKDKK